MIRPFDINDIPQLLDIYNYYVLKTSTTLDHTVAQIKGFTRNIIAIEKKYPVLVVEINGQVIGYSYASLWKAKHGYNKTAESTIYVHPDAKSKGLGTKLYRALIKELRTKNFKVVIGCLTLPNAISVGLHEKLGFIKVAHFPGDR